MAGAAAARFKGVMEQWRAAQQQMEQSLQNIQQSMSRASATYAQAEADAQHLLPADRRQWRSPISQSLRAS